MAWVAPWMTFLESISVHLLHIGWPEAVMGLIDAPSGKPEKTATKTLARSRFVHDSSLAKRGRYNGPHMMVTAGLMAHGSCNTILIPIIHVVHNGPGFVQPRWPYKKATGTVWCRPHQDFLLCRKNFFKLLTFKANSRKASTANMATCQLPQSDNRGMLA